MEQATGGNVRLYGQAPYRVAVIHGGPGAPGEMAPVARALSRERGILEPLQTKATIDGLLRELHDVLRAHGDGPVVLVGHSWGAWLSLLAAGRFPGLVGKVILVASGPFTEEHAAKIMETRLARLSPREQQAVYAVMRDLSDPDAQDKDALMATFGALMAKTDAFDPLPQEEANTLPCQEHLFQSVWNEAHALRKSGELLQLVKYVRCPVVAIHGEDDAHPAQGVAEPLSLVLDAFRCILLKECGHTPWLEKRARDAFYRILRAEIAEAFDAGHVSVAKGQGL